CRAEISHIYRRLRKTHRVAGSGGGGEKAKIFRAFRDLEAQAAAAGGLRTGWRGHGDRPDYREAAVTPHRMVLKAACSQQPPLRSVQPWVDRRVQGEPEEAKTGMSSFSVVFLLFTALPACSQTP